MIIRGENVADFCKKLERMSNHVNVCAGSRMAKLDFCIRNEEDVDYSDGLYYFYSTVSQYSRDVLNLLNATSDKGVYLLLESYDASNTNPTALSDFDFMGYAATEETAKTWVGKNPTYRKYVYCPMKEVNYD